METEQAGLFQPRGGCKQNQRAVKGVSFIYRVAFAIATVFKHPLALIIHQTQDKGEQFYVTCFTRCEVTLKSAVQLGLGVLPQVKWPQHQILNINLILCTQNQSPHIAGQLVWLVCLNFNVKLISIAVIESTMFTEINMDRTNLWRSNCGLSAMARATVTKTLTQQVRRVYVATVSKDHHTVTWPCGWQGTRPKPAVGWGLKWGNV